VRNARSEPMRWKAERNPQTSNDRWLRDAFRAAAHLGTRDEVGLERIWRGLADATSHPRKRVARRWVLAVGGFVLGASTGALAAIGYYTLHRGYAPSASSAPSYERREERLRRVQTRSSTDFAVSPSPSNESLAVAGEAKVEVPPIPAGGTSLGSVEAMPIPGSANSPLHGEAFESDIPGRASALSRPRPGASTRLGANQRDGVRLPSERLSLSPPRLDPPGGRLVQRVEVSSTESARTTPGEGTLLAEALSSLRGAGDARRALERLGLYTRLYPSGRLSQEAALIEAEALFRSGDEKMALAQLDRLPMAEIAGTRPLMLLRGELRASHSRYREAVADLGVVFRPDRPDELSERALFTRAACQERLGKTGDARSDVEAYLRLFPLGVHRIEARAFLTVVDGARLDSTGSP